jgi:hypothetical protein
MSIIVANYADEVIGDHQCGFQRKRLTTNKIFCIRHILEENGSTRISQKVKEL